MNTGGNGDGDGDQSLLDDEPLVCDTVSLNSKIAATPSLTTSNIVFIMASLLSQATDCSQTEVADALAAYLANNGIVKVCPTPSLCGPVAKIIVRNGIQNAIATENSSMTIMQIPGVVPGSTICQMPAYCAALMEHEEELDNLPH